MNDTEITRHRRVLVIDDTPAVQDDFLKILQGHGSRERAPGMVQVTLLGETPQQPTEDAGGFSVDVASQGQEGLELVRRAKCDGTPYALAFVDIRMPPGWDGIDTVSRLWAEDADLQVVICTAYSDYTWADVIKRLNPHDNLLILKKPFYNMEVRQLAHVLIQKWALAKRAQLMQVDLDRLVLDRTAEITETRDITTFLLARLVDSRDPETGEHVDRIRAYCRIIAEQLLQEGTYRNEVDTEFVKDLYRSSPLHDIGKVGIPDAILLKPDQLTTEEFELMKRHTVIGADTLDEAARHARAGGFLAMATQIARHHHERFDGSGYPDGLKGNEIPISARIVALADVYDALTSARVYKEAFDAGVARLMIENGSGRHFDPAVVRAFLTREDDFLRVLRYSVASPRPRQNRTEPGPPLRSVSLSTQLPGTLVGAPL